MKLPAAGLVILVVGFGMSAPAAREIYRRATPVAARIESILGGSSGRR